MSIFFRKSTSDLLKGIDNVGLASPFAEPGNLTRVVLSEIFGANSGEDLPLSREEAIQIPAVSKVRNLLISTIAPLPLKALDERGELAAQPSWLYRSDSLVSPFERMAWVVDDLLFYGYSLLLVEREDGQIVSADYCPMSEWTISDGHILVDEKPVSADSVILINSPYEGLLTVGARKLREARDVETQIAAKVANPIPLTVIRATEDIQLDQSEIDALLSDWTKARRSKEGALGYLPNGLTIDTHGESDPALFYEERNAIVTNIGQLTNVGSSMLDGTSSVDSLTYVTKAGERSAFLTFDLPFWLAPIEARLSQDDVTPPGTRIRFDTSELINDPTPTGAPVKD